MRSIPRRRVRATRATGSGAVRYERHHFSRNSAVTNLNGAGIPDTVAMTITGHRTLAVYKRYGIRQESVQRAAMEKVEAYVHGLGSDDDKRKAV